MRKLMTDEVLQCKVACFLLAVAVILMLAGRIAEDRRAAERMAAGISIERMIAGEGR